MFLSTRKPEAIYKFLISSCKENIENDLKKKLKFEIFKIEKFPRIDYLFFVIYRFLVPDHNTEFSYLLKVVFVFQQIGLKSDFL